VPGEGAMMDGVAPAAVLANQLAPAPFNDRYTRTLGSDLTPQQVTLILNNADSGYLWQLADLCDEIRERDGHLHSELQKRELRVAGADWELIPPEGSGERGETIAKWCMARIREIEGCGDLSRDFVSAVADLQGAVFQGRVGLEAVWRDEGGWYVPRELYFLHPRRFAYGTDWRIHLWDASGTSPTSWVPMNTDSPFGLFPGLPLDRFPAGKFIVHRPRVRGVYPVKEGLGRLLVW
jgi:phage gp29-like protein